MSDHDKAPFFGLECGLNGVDYKQSFVKAPLSQHPKAPSKRDDLDPSLKMPVLKAVCGHNYK